MWCGLYNKSGVIDFFFLVGSNVWFIVIELNKYKCKQFPMRKYMQFIQIFVVHLSFFFVIVSHFLWPRQIAFESIYCKIYYNGNIYTSYNNIHISIIASFFFFFFIWLPPHFNEKINISLKKLIKYKDLCGIVVYRSK